MSAFHPISVIHQPEAGAKSGLAGNAPIADVHSARATTENEGAPPLNTSTHAQPVINR